MANSKISVYVILLLEAISSSTITSCSLGLYRVPLIPLFQDNQNPEVVVPSSRTGSTEGCLTPSRVRLFYLPQVVMKLGSPSWPLKDWVRHSISIICLNN